MRIAVKYSMDNVQAAILRFINSLPGEESAGIGKLAFLAEFSNYFSRDTIKEVFVGVCAENYHPSGRDLSPLFAHPNLLALMMQYREEILKPDEARWHEQPAQPSHPWRQLYMVDSITWREKWLDEQFKSLGFS